MIKKVIWRFSVVVPIVDNDDLYNTLTEIEYKDAIKIEPDYQVGEELYEEVDIQKEFGRRAILAGKQTLASRINDLKRTLLIKKYEDRVGDIVSGEVYRFGKKKCCCWMKKEMK